MKNFILISAIITILTSCGAQASNVKQTRPPVYTVISEGSRYEDVKYIVKDKVNNCISFTWTLNGGCGSQYEKKVRLCGNYTIEETINK